MMIPQASLNFVDLPCTQANFRFVKDSPLYQTEIPYEVVGTLPPEEENLRSNLKWEGHEVPVHDLRQHASSLSIETNGFELIRRKELSVFDLDTETGFADYLSAVLKFLKERFCTDDVIIYNYNVRLYPKLHWVRLIFNS
jgi:hypothetical protein